MPSLASTHSPQLHNIEQQNADLLSPPNSVVPFPGKMHPKIHHDIEEQ
jgi:hypothetical protein